MAECDDTFASGRGQPIEGGSEPCVKPSWGIGRCGPDGIGRSQLKTTPNVNAFTYIVRLHRHNAGVDQSMIELTSRTRSQYHDQAPSRPNESSDC
jgi:hypothetical protein